MQAFKINVLPFTSFQRIIRYFAIKHFLLGLPGDYDKNNTFYRSYSHFSCTTTSKILDISIISKSACITSNSRRIKYLKCCHTNCLSVNDSVFIAHRWRRGWRLLSYNEMMNVYQIIKPCKKPHLVLAMISWYFL